MATEKISQHQKRRHVGAVGRVQWAGSTIIIFDHHFSAATHLERREAEVERARPEHCSTPRNQ